MDIIKFWAKTSKDGERENAFHPLICHLIDVAAVTKKMWKEVLPQAAKDRINKSFGIADAENLVAFIAGLHDLGKCSPPFALRGLNEPKNKQTNRFLSLYRNTPFDVFPVSQTREAPHGYVTAVELPAILTSEKLNFNRQISKQISTMIGGHHGVFPSTGKLREIETARTKSLGNEHWEDKRIELVETLADLLNVEPLNQNDSAKLDNGTIMLLAGLVSVADWIGSMSEYFECAAEQTVDNKVNFKWKSLDAYLEHAEAKASEALQKLGWIARRKENSVKTFDINQSPEEKFEKLFPFIKDRRHLQDMAIEISKELKTPGIAVIEAPTGEGKTEAAMFLADAWNTFLNQDGYYFALPTQATSNQMFGRAVNFLENRFPDSDVQLQLLHGHASLSAEFKTLKEEYKKIKDVFDDQCEGDECVPSIVAAEWFTYRKRGLLAPFGVGTVDQALMAVLQTKHVFVRLFGLAHKTIIIDEVHAYDAYMSTLLERLLEWLAALGSPVILLSATLPIERRNKLIEAYQRGLGVGTNEIQKADYPRISYATDSTINVKHIKTSDKKRTLFIEKYDENFIENLKEKLKKDKGCVAIICNTVQRSQEIYELLSNDKDFQGNDEIDGLPILDLLHSRFRFCDRDTIEKRVRIRFGKEGEKIKVTENDKDIEKKVKRPKFAVLVSTQIIEQSLDIDFDLMISDLAPIDLLLQRAGRLHRHERTRSDEFKLPTLWLIKPKIKEDGVPNFENSIVYDEHILLRTWLELNKKEYEKIEIPDEVEKLIESVYDIENKYNGQDKKIEKCWEKSLAKYKKEMCKEEVEAENRWIAMPNAPLELYKLLGGKDEQLEEDSLAFHKEFRALTRLNADSLTLVCLYKKYEKVFLDSDYEVEVDFKNVILSNNLKEDEKKIVTENIKLLLGNSLSVSRKDLILTILESNQTKIPSEWEKSPLLKSCRVLWLDEDSTVEIENFFIYLHSELGLKVLKFMEDN